MLTLAFSSIFAALNLNFYLEGKVATMIEIIKKKLPTIFFTPKYMSNGGPCFQLIEYHGRALSVTCFTSERVDVTHSQEISSDTLFQNTDNEQHNYWYLPYQIANIPIIDFQYISWLPSDYKPIYTYQTYIFEEFYEIRNLNNIQLGHARVSITTPPRPPPLDLYTPPPAPSRPPPAAEPPKPVRIRESSLPSHVIDALIRDAKSGRESCPISMNTYADCEKLSITSCFHIFNKESIDYWLKDNTTCPVCRKESTVIA